MTGRQLFQEPPKPSVQEELLALWAIRQAVWDPDNILTQTIELLARRIDQLEARVRELEKHSHEPVDFVEDKNGFLKLAKVHEK